MKLMKPSKNEIIKEWSWDTEQPPHNVRSKIVRDLNGQFHWSASHYYKPSERDGSVYRPSQTTAGSFEECKISMDVYMNRFKTQYGVEKCEFY